MNSDQRKMMCAIYTRKSTEEGLEKEYNTLDAQYDACSAYIRSQAANGWEIIPKRYDDGGYSGGNVNRPGLRELQADIVAGRVNIVVVYKIDRLSRSLCDFADLSKLFEKHGVSFVSVTQQIDTSSAAGRMMLGILFSFAQFEREICSDRIRDKIYATIKKGLWVGGPTPFGYRLENKNLVVDEEASETVKRIFRRYVTTGSALQVCRELNSLGLRNGCGGKWNPRQVTRILRNCTYIGRIRSARTGEMFEGRFDAIVDKAIWDKVQKIFDENHPDPGDAPRRETTAILRGILKCGTCGGAMGATYANYKGNKYRKYIYYRCTKDSKRSERECPLGAIPADVIEKFVFEQLGGVLRDPEVVKAVSGGDSAREEAFLRETEDLAGFWAQLVSSERSRLVALLVKEVTVWEDRVRISLTVGDRVIETPCKLKVNMGRRCIVVQKEDGAGGDTDESSEMAAGQMLVKTHQWLELLTSGTYHTKNELADAIGLSRSYLARVTQLPFLSPDIVEGVMDGRIDKASVTMLMKATSPLWAEQHRQMGI